jgi:hypothetical protein
MANSKVVKGLILGNRLLKMYGVTDIETAKQAESKNIIFQN